MRIISHSNSDRFAPHFPVRRSLAAAVLLLIATQASGNAWSQIDSRSTSRRTRSQPPITRVAENPLPAEGPSAASVGSPQQDSERAGSVLEPKSGDADAPLLIEPPRVDLQDAAPMPTLPRLPDPVPDETAQRLNPLFEPIVIDKVDIGFSPISEIGTDVQVPGDGPTPANLAAELFRDTPTLFYVSDQGMDYRFPQMTPTAADFCYQPLYFEELNLERHGRGMGHWQPLASGIRFFGTVPLLPYKMALNHPRTHLRSKDPFPAGLPAPYWIRETAPFSRQATRKELAAIAAVILIFP